MSDKTNVSMRSVPVNIFTGFLGAGKTTIIKNLLEQIERPEKVVWLKNEYGDVNIDALLVKETRVIPKEIMNGCLCCVLVGRLHEGLAQILEENKPERIIIETSGTAWPGPIVREVFRLPELYVDSVVNVIDTENFTGYDDISYASKMQTTYVDLIIFNKYPINVQPATKAELDLEHRLDDVYAVFPHTPKVKTVDGHVDLSLLIGLDANTMKQLDVIKQDTAATSEHEKDHADEVESFTYRSDQAFTKQEIENVINSFPPREFMRIKGVVKTTDDQALIYNWVLGKGQWQTLKDYNGETLIVFMGKSISHLYKEVESRFSGLK